MSDKILESFSEILLSILPESTFGKIVWLGIVAVFILILTGRLRLEWIGAGLVYLWSRFIKCPMGKHAWRLAGIGWCDLNRGGGVEGPYVCKYCGKQDYFIGTIG